MDRAPVYKYLEKSLDELNAKKLIVLIPFQLLRLRRAIEKERTRKNMEALKNLITHDILDSLNQNVIAGSITAVESIKLGRMIFELYKHIYGSYDELVEEGVNQMAEEALIFDVDILDYQIRKLEKEMELLEEKRLTLESQNQSLSASAQVWKLYARGATVGEIAKKTGIPAEKIAEILESD